MISICSLIYMLIIIKKKKFVKINTSKYLFIFSMYAVETQTTKISILAYLIKNKIGLGWSLPSFTTRSLLIFISSKYLVFFFFFSTLRTLPVFVLPFSPPENFPGYGINLLLTMIFYFCRLAHIFLDCIHSFHCKFFWDYTLPFVIYVCMHVWLCFQGASTIFHFTL